MARLTVLKRTCVFHSPDFDPDCLICIGQRD